MNLRFKNKSRRVFQFFKPNEILLFLIESKLVTENLSINQKDFFKGNFEMRKKIAMNYLLAL